MLQFTTDGFEFEVDGVIHHLPELNIEMFVTIADFVLIEKPADQMIAFRDALIAAAAPETGEAIRKLGLRQTTRLFRDWSGLGGGQVAPGESLSSPE